MATSQTQAALQIWHRGKVMHNSLSTSPTMLLCSHLWVPLISSTTLVRLVLVDRICTDMQKLRFRRRHAMPVLRKTWVIRQA